MKNQLDFKVPFVASWGNANFIYCFTSAYVFVQNIDVSGIVNYPCPPRNNGQPCHGCGNLRKGKCDAAALNKVSPYLFLFDTMTGCNSLHDRYDREPNEMQKLVGLTADNNSCGTEHTTDFLFGFTGYEYYKCTDVAKFKSEIAKAIDAGKPVIAEGKPGKGRGGRFHVITGYDGDTLLMSPTDDYFYQRARPDGAPTYDELVTLYIFGDKIAPRYTLIDGLKNIKRVREYNITEKIWDDYLAKMKELDNVDMEEKRIRLSRMLETIRYTMNTHGIQKAFQDIHLRHEEMLAPELAPLWKNIKSTAQYMGHGPENLIAKINWDTIRPSTFHSISKTICEAIAKAKEADLQMFDHINQAIEMLERGNNNA